MQQTEPNRIRAERLRRGWTLRVLADKCTAKGAPASFAQLSRIEHGQTPRPALRQVLAELLDLDVINDFEVSA